MVFFAILIGVMGSAFSIDSDTKKKNPSEDDSSTEDEEMNHALSDRSEKNSKVISTTADRFVEIQALIQQTQTHKKSEQTVADNKEEFKNRESSMRIYPTSPPLPDDLRTHFNRIYEESIIKQQGYWAQHRKRENHEKTPFLRFHDPVSNSESIKERVIANRNKRHKEKLAEWTLRLEEIKKQRPSSHNNRGSQTASELRKALQIQFSKPVDFVSPRQREFNQRKTLNVMNEDLKGIREEKEKVVSEADLEIRYNHAVNEAEKYYEKLEHIAFRNTDENKQKLIEIAKTFNYLKIGRVTGAITHEKFFAAEKFARQNKQLYENHMKQLDKTIIPNRTTNETINANSSQTVSNHTKEHAPDSPLDTEDTSSVVFSPEADKKNERLVNLFKYIEQKKEKLSTEDLHQYETAQHDFIKLLEIYLKAQETERILFESVFTEGQDLLISTLSFLKNELIEQLKKELEQRVEVIRERND